MQSEIELDHRLEAVRIHESGHAIAAAYWGFPVHHLRLDAAGGECLVITSGHLDELEALRYLQVVVAGVESENAINLDFGSACSLDDSDLAMALALQLASAPDDVYQTLAFARQEAYALLLSHWPAVEALATSLQLNDDHLEGPDVAAALEAAVAGEVWTRPQVAVPAVAGQLWHRPSLLPAASFPAETWSPLPATALGFPPARFAHVSSVYEGSLALAFGRSWRDTMLALGAGRR